MVGDRGAQNLHNNKIFKVIKTCNTINTVMAQITNETHELIETLKLSGIHFQWFKICNVRGLSIIV